MKSGLALVELATALERQSETKKDFVASTSVLEMTPKGELTLETETSSNEFPVTENCHTQIAAKLDIPAKYYNRMRKEAPELLATNVNEWFHNKPSRRMIRTLDEQARAFLSDR
ncbi:MAG TPA: hypothetical protein V6D09_18350 [Leptolyngbyaceae cyanobacterium]